MPVPLTNEDQAKFDELINNYGPYPLLRAMANWFEPRPEENPDEKAAMEKAVTLLKKTAKELTEITWFPDTPPPGWRGPWPK